MLILVEGADKNGKTTLSKRIADLHGYRYVHKGPPEGGADGYIDELLKIKHPTVMDRSFIGELVYGPLLRHGCCLSHDQSVTLLRLTARLNGLVIYARQTQNTRATWHEDDKELGIDWTVNQEADKQFEHVMGSMVKRFVLTLDYHANTFKEMDAFIRKHESLFKHLRSDELLKESWSGVGTLKPQMILVGDQINKKVTWRNLPFDGGASACYLNETLNQARIPQGMIHMMNSRSHDGEYNNYNELINLTDNFKRDCKLVALGENASRWLTQLELAHYRIEHPQHRRRFKYGDIKEYARQLEVIYHE